MDANEDQQQQQQVIVTQQEEIVHEVIQDDGQQPHQQQQQHLTTTIAMVDENGEIQMEHGQMLGEIIIINVNEPGMDESEVILLEETGTEPEDTIGGRIRHAGGKRRASKRASTGTRKSSKKAKKDHQEQENIDGQLMTGQSQQKVKGAEEEDEESCSYAVETLFLRCTEPNCMATFTSKHERTEHLKHIHEIKPFKCPLEQCAIRCDSSSELSKHIKDQHHSVDMWKCPKCPNEFRKYKLLYMHMWIMHDEGHFKCPHPGCNFDATYRKQVYNHIDHRHQMLKFKCPFDGCTKGFTNKNELKAHERRAHLLLKPYRCKWPGCAYSSEVCPAVIRHIRTQHFHLPETMRKQREKNIVDYRDPREYLDVICDPNKVYAVLTPANKSQEPKRYICSQPDCGKSFLRAANLKIHERGHLGLKPFQCKFAPGQCSFASERKETVVQHVRTTHFNLPRSAKEQKDKCAADGRNADDYIEVVTEQFDDPNTRALVAAMTAANQQHAKQQAKQKKEQLASRVVASPSKTATVISVAKTQIKSKSKNVAPAVPASSIPFPVGPPRRPLRRPPLLNPPPHGSIPALSDFPFGANPTPTTHTPRQKHSSSNATAPTTRKTTSTASTTPGKTPPVHACTHPNCGKVFRRPANLKDHERIHLGLKPFTCSYGQCTFASGRKENVIQHVRTSHFHLPRSKKEQTQKKIEDYRDPNEFVAVNRNLMN